jgi:hypothetical protein
VFQAYPYPEIKVMVGLAWSIERYELFTWKGKEGRYEHSEGQEAKESVREETFDVY